MHTFTFDFLTNFYKPRDPFPVWANDMPTENDMRNYFRKEVSRLFPDPKLSRRETKHKSTCTSYQWHTYMSMVYPQFSMLPISSTQPTNLFRDMGKTWFSVEYK